MKPTASAYEGTLRVLVLVYGLGCVVYGILAVPNIVAQWAYLAPAWTIATLLLCFALPAVLGMVSRVAPAVWLRRLIGVDAAAYLLAMATLPLALDFTRLPYQLGTPWLLDTSALVAAAAAIAWSAVATWPTVLAAGVAVTALRLVCSGLFPDLVPIAIEDGLFALLTCAVFAGLGLLSVRSGRTVDVATAESSRLALQAAEAGARAAERGRIAALVHDRVLAALLVAGTAEPRLAAVAAAEARARTNAIAGMLAGEGAPSAVDLPGHAFAWSIQALTTELDPLADFSLDIAPDQTVPADVTDALREACAEALRNSIRHAARPDAPVHRAVHVTVGRSGGAVTVLDDGVGFDRALARREGLGIELSIVGRLAAVEGCRADIVTQVGVGTRVELAWRRT
jgi:signal transduction histidine kinase